jgi:hypothetical protein
MSLYSFLFWGLVLATALVSLRWGAMIGLIVFVFALMAGAVAISRWSPPKADATAGALLVPAEAGRITPFSDRISIFSMR